MSFGKIAWSGMLDVDVLPSHMDLFQAYGNARLLAFLAATRTPGIISGGTISVVAGMQIQVSAGLALMPDGTIIQFDPVTATLAAADSSNPRIDRIELTYAATNNQTVLDVNSQTKTLDILFVGSLSVVQGTPSSTPVIPNSTAANISLGQVTVPAGAGSVTGANIMQVVDSGFVVSALKFFNSSLLIRANPSSSQLQYSTDGSRYQAIGSGGGGGGGSGANWQTVDGLAPEEVFEYMERAYKFQIGAKQSASLCLRVPSSYLSGSPIALKLSHYSPSASGAWQFSAVTSLIRINIDSMGTTANQHTSINGESVQTGSLKYMSASYDLTDTHGLINGLSVSPGDMLIVDLTRVAPQDTEDTGDVRMIPSTTEVSFS